MVCVCVCVHNQNLMREIMLNVWILEVEEVLCYNYSPQNVSKNTTGHVHVYAQRLHTTTIQIFKLVQSETGRSTCTCNNRILIYMNQGLVYWYQLLCAMNISIQIKHDVIACL